MTNSLHHAFRRNLNRVLARSLVVGAIVTAGILGGIVPSWTGTSYKLALSSLAAAQTFSDSEITNYARAVLAIEPVRQAAFNEIKRTVSAGDLSSVVCNRQAGIARLPRSIRRVVVDYCRQSKTIVESYGLTPSRFNEITLKIRNDQELQQLVQRELLRLQRNR
ncbi:hypothetical protein DO97_03390 [Neosynechococcus sphagnicola sy1]|uniref:DUF4168 domain-containing protein n=1 Tax=Neosynechococcus sphagnicola sy1 TaxID=1497020 RepID=A0A098TLA1_9CYAN|nr:DUF4168 domain-containing protein [Neosynechococcus sphagnicola]KGF73080.1 hypothetical protein DO97_03390 [Neosynechococcus sphagnicola sy1]